MVRPQSVHVGQNPRISKIDECGIDKEAGGVSGMENVKVHILDSTTIEIWGGVCFGVEWGGVLGFTLASSADQVGFFLNSPEANIFCYLRLVSFVEEDERVMASVASIKESLSNAWMGGVI